mmetsp:Transcript_11346/g.22841  ORF Transcript_11346/g.22841 Transcript_11346/m.22841 type:complete len:83 (+) Transcript_11346:958-1206(+)
MHDIIPDGGPGQGEGRRDRQNNTLLLYFFLIARSDPIRSSPQENQTKKKKEEIRTNTRATTVRKNAFDGFATLHVIGHVATD